MSCVVIASQAAPCEIRKIMVLRAFSSAACMHSHNLLWTPELDVPPLPTDFSLPSLFCALVELGQDPGRLLAETFVVLLGFLQIPSIFSFLRRYTTAAIAMNKLF